MRRDWPAPGRSDAESGVDFYEAVSGARKPPNSMSVNDRASSAQNSFSEVMDFDPVLSFIMERVPVEVV